MTRTPKEMQRILDGVREEIPRVPWGSSFSDGGANTRTWTGRTAGYNFIILEHRDPLGITTCLGTVGVTKDKLAIKLPTELARMAVRAAKDAT